MLEEFVNGVFSRDKTVLAYSISSVAETRDRDLSFFQGSRIYEMGFQCLPH